MTPESAPRRSTGSGLVQAAGRIWRARMRGPEMASLAEPPPRFGTPIAGAEAGLILATNEYSKSLIEPALAADRSEHSTRGTAMRHKQQATAMRLPDV